MQLNEIKYPVKRCLQSKSQAKYTEYSKETGVTENNQNLKGVTLESRTPIFDFGKELPALTAMSIKFVSDRGWRRYDTPEKLLIAMMGETGELCELANGNEKDVSTDDIAQEIADVAIYAIRFAEICGATKHVNSIMTKTDTIDYDSKFL